MKKSSSLFQRISLVAMIVLSFLIILSACSSGSSGANKAGKIDNAQNVKLEEELVIVTTGGIFDELMVKHFFQPFTEQTGVKIKAVPLSNSEQWTQVSVMTQSKNIKYDIVAVYPEDFGKRNDQLYNFEKCDELPNVKEFGVDGTCKQYGVLRTIGGGVIAYNKKAFANEAPKNWADFWDVKKFPGPRSLPNNGVPWWNLAAALLADGVTADKLFPLDVDRAFRKLDEIKPQIKAWWKTGDQSQQLLRDGEVVMSMMWSGRAMALQGSGVPLEIVWNQGIKDVAYWGMLKDAPHQKAAKAFLNYFLSRPEAHLAFSVGMNYDTANAKAIESLPEDKKKTHATHPSNWDNMFEIESKWVAENRDVILERWNKWIAQ